MFDHERLNVYQVNLQFVGWVFERVTLSRKSERISRSMDLMLKKALVSKEPIVITITMTSTSTNRNI